MATSPTIFAPQKSLEDPLAHLPCSSIVEYRKGQMIYNQDQPSTAIYLVIDGKVKVSRLVDDGHQVVVDIYQPDEFFGESAFLNLLPLVIGILMAVIGSRTAPVPQAGRSQAPSP